MISGCKLETMRYGSVEFRFMTADTLFDHDATTIFLKRFLKELEGLFVQLLMAVDLWGCRWM